MAINEFYEEVSLEEYEEDFSNFLMDCEFAVATDYMEIDENHFLERTASRNGSFCRMYIRYEEPVEVQLMNPETGEKYTSLNTRYTYSLQYWCPGGKSKVVQID